MKTKSVEPVTAGASRPRLKLRCDYRDLDLKCWPRPSELELAQLAAQLARTEKIDAKALVEEAWELYWESCRTIQTDYLKVQTHVEPEVKKEEQGNAQEAETLSELPVPKQYPVSYAELELLLMPKLKGRTADRAKTMREFLFQEYVASRSTPMKVASGARQEVLTAEQLMRLRAESTAELDRLIGQVRARSIGAQDYAGFAQRFLDWERRRTGFVKSMVRSASARRSWVKRRKDGKAKTGARPNYAKLKKIIEPPKKGLDGSSG